MIASCIELCLILKLKRKGMKLNVNFLSGKKTALIVIVLSFLIYSCSCQNEKNYLTIGFGKANLIKAGIYEDPVDNNQDLKDGNKYKYEEKFAISDRAEGRWRPGSGGIRHIADSIYVSAMYGEDIKGPWAIIALDETEIDYKLLDILEDPLINQLRIPKERLVFLPSHCHSIPRMDPVKYQKAVLDAVKQARDNKTEIEIASFDSKIDGKRYVISRRIDVEGIGSHTVMFNDGCVVYDDYLDATENIRDWVKTLGPDPSAFLDPDKKYITRGEVDNNLQVLFFRDKKSGEMKGSFIRFAAHAVISSAKVVNGDVSADFPGYLKRKIENDLGGIALFGQGASGDLRPLNKEYSHEFAKKYGENLASKIIQSYQELNWQPLTKLVFHTQPVVLPLKDSIFFSEDGMKEEMSKIEVLYDKEANPRQKRILQDKFWGVYRAPEVHSMVRPAWKEKKQIEMNLCALQINDKVIIASLGELFTRTGKQIIEPFSDKNPLLVTIANECISYVPTDEERDKGGYEPGVSIVASGTSDTLIQSAHKLLSTIYGRPLEIKKEYCGKSDSEISKNKINRKSVLQGEINGINTYYIELFKDNPYLIRPGQNSVSLYLITHGKGIITQGVRQFEVNGLNLFVPSILEEASVLADTGDFGMLKIVIRLTSTEYQLLKQKQNKLPYFVDYTRCRQYKEAIKSEKTISRMILPEDIIPRFCMGSVETCGPDKVGAHSHPMLEQLFYGLKSNDCIVEADGIKTAFEENILLHIPLGSRHGVDVEEGKLLNYVWMDLFRSQEDMGYIKENHIMKDK
jgi:hypothetical protein